jgi:hypothetical protein
MVRSLLAVALTLSFASVAQAQTPAHYNLAICNSVKYSYPWTGSMNLTFFPDGAIQGYLFPADQPKYVPVEGSRSNGSVWLQIGSSGRWRLQGHVQNDGNIVGASWGTPLGPGLYDFVARPVPGETSHGVIIRSHVSFTRGGQSSTARSHLESACPPVVP